MKKQVVESILESSSSLLYHCGLIRSDRNGIIETDIGSYASEGDIHGAIQTATFDLEAELPKITMLKLEGGEIKVLRKDNDPNAESCSFRPVVGFNPSLEDEEVLRKIIDAQGGRFKKYGFFRFDTVLAKQDMFNCDNCGEIWKSSRQQPKRCPVCREPQPPRPPHRTTQTVTHSDYHSPPEFSKLCSVNMVQDTILSHVDKDDNRFPQLKTYPSKKIPPMRLKDEPEVLEKTLWRLMRSYDSEYLNTIRSTQENEEMIQLLKSVEDSILCIMNSEDYCCMRAWTDSTRPIGNWPYTPWISFGLSEGFYEKDGFHSIHGHVNINCMIMIDTHSQTVVLGIVPNVKELIQSYGQRWTLELRPFKEEMRNKISWITEEGFSFDDEPNFWTLPYSSGDKMRIGLVTYRYFSIPELFEEKVQDAIRVVMKAYLKLVI